MRQQNECAALSSSLPSSIPKENPMVFSVFRCVKFRNLDSRNPGLQLVFTSNANQSLSLPGVWDDTLFSNGLLKLLLLKFFVFNPLDARCLFPKRQRGSGFCEIHFPWCS